MYITPTVIGLSNGSPVLPSYRIDLPSGFIPACCNNSSTSSCVAPSNTDQGYIVRRLLRRAIRFGRGLGITKDMWTKEVASVVINDYKDTYPELGRNQDFIEHCERIRPEAF